MNFEKSNNHRGFSFSNVFLNQKTLAVFGLTILIVITMPLVKNYNQKRMINKEIKEMESEIARVENKNNDLRKLIEYFESDQFVEEQARMNFGLKKGGEQVAVVKDPALNAQNEKLAPNSGDQIFDIPGLQKQLPLKVANNPSKWWNYYFHK